MGLFLSSNDMRVVYIIYLVILVCGLIVSLWMVISLVKTLFRPKRPSQDLIIYKILLLISATNSCAAVRSIVFTLSHLHVKGIHEFIEAGSTFVSVLRQFGAIITYFTYFWEALLAFQVYQMTTVPKRLNYRLFTAFMLLFLAIRFSLAIHFTSLAEFYQGTLQFVDISVHAVLWIYFFVMLIILSSKIRQPNTSSRMKYIIKRVSISIIIFLTCFFGTICTNFVFLKEKYIDQQIKNADRHNVVFVGSMILTFLFYPLNALGYSMSRQCCCLYGAKEEMKDSLAVVNFINATEVQIHEKNCIGFGAMGIVYEGLYRGTVVAVKKIELCSDSDHVASQDQEFFIQEAATLNRLSHPNIIYYMGAFIKDNNGYIVCEYCNSGSLSNLLSSLKMKSCVGNFEWKYQIALGIAYGLNYLHCMKVVHRDLKSANVLVVDNVLAKVADFGTAKLLSTLAKSKAASSNYSKDVGLHTAGIGTVRWTAPEMLKHHNRRANYGQAIDVYSFGIILWELITFDIPFSDIQFNFLILPIVISGKRPTIPADSNIPHKFIQLMESCWAQEPEDRPKMDDVIKELQELKDRLVVVVE